MEKLPKISGDIQLNISSDFQKTLLDAEKIASQMKDEFITEEHLLLALIDSGETALKNIFQSLGITRSSIEKTITKMRNGEKVTSNDAENKLNALKKYGIDLVEQARSGKIDPVIGREDEIRRTLQILSRRTKNNPVLL